MIDRFPPFLSPDRSTPWDPINLIFFGNGTAANVAAHLQHSLPDRWQRNRLSHPMYAYIDDVSHGGRAAWKRPDADLALGPLVFGERRHIRIYQGNVPDRHPADRASEYGVWSLAGVHREHFALPDGHRFVEWNEPRDFLAEALSGLPFVGAVYQLDLGTGGSWQGRPFDGLATFIELL